MLELENPKPGKKKKKNQQKMGNKSTKNRTKNGNKEPNHTTLSSFQGLSGRSSLGSPNSPSPMLRLPRTALLAPRGNRLLGRSKKEAKRDQTTGDESDQRRARERWGIGNRKSGGNRVGEVFD